MSVKNKISTRELNKRMGIVCAADVVRQGSLRCFCRLEHKGKDKGCRNVFVARATRRGRVI